MTELTTVVDSYIAMWNETDPERRRSIIEQTWTADGTYVDPQAEVSGADGLDALGPRAAPPRAPAGRRPPPPRRARPGDGPPAAPPPPPPRPPAPPSPPRVP